MAKTTPNRVGAFSTSPTTLILEMPEGHLVYEWKDRRLERIQVVGEEQTRQILPLSQANAVEFVSGPLVTIRITEASNRGPTRYEFSAALQGGLR